jgi:two-component system, NarL family, sensor histidine kinase DevS
MRRNAIRVEGLLTYGPGGSDGSVLAVAARGDERNAKLVEAGVALSSELSLEAVLQRIVDVAAEITGARYCALGVLGPDGTIAEFITHGVTPEQRATIGHIPVGRGILGVLIHDAKPLRLTEIAQDPRSVGFPPNHPPMRAFLGAPLTARGRVFGNLYLTKEPGQGEFDDEDERAVVVLAKQAGVAIENARLYEESRLRERRLDAVREIGAAILEGQEPEIILDLIARRAREMVDADAATVAIPSLGEGSLEVRVAVGAHEQELRGMTFPAEGSLNGEVMVTGEPIVLEYAQEADRPLIGTGEFGPMMLVPLMLRDRAFGTVSLANLVGGRRFTPDDLSLVETFAGQAIVALEYWRAQQELKRLILMEDRERIAKELHDGVIQSLFAVGMGLQATATLSRDQDIEERIQSAVGEVDRVIRDLRNYIFGLRPGIFADRQLDQALRQLAQDTEEKTGVVTAVDLDPRVAAELAGRGADVIQFTREALSNVGRHSGARTCRLTLRRKDDQTALLEVDDDGKGFDPKLAAGKGQGLGNLQARADSFGGSLEIESTPGEGTTVRALIPL